MLPKLTRRDVTAPRLSLVSCLETLGIQCRSKPALKGQHSPHEPHNSRQQTIYVRYALWEIEDMAERAYKGLIRDAHPDRGGSLEECIRINQAYSRIKHLVQKRRDAGM